MAETKAPKLRRTKKDTTRQTDDVTHTLAAMPTNGTSHERINGLHAEMFSRYDGDEDERRRMIAEAAYYRALRRGFANGSPESDWLEAEAEIIALLSGSGVRA